MYMVDVDMMTDSHSYTYKVKSMAYSPKVDDGLVVYGPGVTLDLAYGLTSRESAMKAET